MDEFSDKKLFSRDFVYNRLHSPFFWFNLNQINLIELVKQRIGKVKRMINVGENQWTFAPKKRGHSVNMKKFWRDLYVSWYIFIKQHRYKCYFFVLICEETVCIKK